MLDLERNVPPRHYARGGVGQLGGAQGSQRQPDSALLNAVAKVHQHGGVLGEKCQFPSVDFVDLPLNEDARRYIVNGPSFLFRWLPYGWAVLLDRLKILIFPILALLIPLFRIAPPLYTWRVRSKIYRWYTAVREIDSSCEKMKRSSTRVPCCVDWQSLNVRSLRSRFLYPTWASCTICACISVCCNSSWKSSEAKRRDLQVEEWFRESADVNTE